MVKNSRSVRKDALYYTALIYDKYYRNSPSATTRLQALNAWNNVKKNYMGTPNNPRFKTANEKLSTIR